ncbi:MAG: exodeoxyribonuclease VII large subunit [Betaproteobacteria bacterium]|nr:exodeoxyribonuclease VII large subunit [Betaproteobacteria bacterium]
MHVDDSNTAIISVAELNRRAREFIEAGFPLLWVAGEISNFTRAASGHCYFSLKDATAQVRCVFFRHKAALIDWKPENGMQVEVRALPTLYEARGDFQLTVEGMRRSGLGALFEAFERLKRKLEREGLFEASRRKPIPEFPGSVGVVTSPKAAALRDVLTTLERRMPGIRVVLYPTPVQGESAGEKIARAIRAASARMEVDVLIVCRGGGSMEDLWAFNEEIVARAIVDCAMPVVSGVGHETDFTITDFVADARAPTPTAAAELVSPNRVELLVRLGVLAARLSRDIDRALNTRMQHLDYLGKSLVHPGERIDAELRHMAHLVQRLRSAATHALNGTAWNLSGLLQRLRGAFPDTDAQIARQQELRLRLQHGQARLLKQHDATLVKMKAGLAHLNPRAVLERGYSIVEKSGGQIVRSVEHIAAGEPLRLIFARGAAQTRVEHIEIPEE